MADSYQLNTRVSRRTRFILKVLAEAWGATDSQVLAVLADRAAQEEGIDASPAAMKSLARNFVSPADERPKKDVDSDECAPFEAD